uniref:Uncharacterized protein n=1 Tax=Trichogramma kaykai TaxID=54128 RepID=A0ABD2WX30_9HYME
MADNTKSLDELISLQNNTDWDIEEQRRQLLHQLYSLIANWKGQLPDLSQIFQPEEIDWLLVQDGFSDESWPYMFSILEFVTHTKYRNNPDVDEDGKLSLRRTTALHRLARKSSPNLGSRMFEFFVIYDRFDVNYVDETGFTHFHVACRFGCKDIVKKFLKHGQDPNCVWPETGDSPLHLALAYEYEYEVKRQLVKLLLKSGADPNWANKNGVTPLHIISKNEEEPDMAKIFFNITDKLQLTLHVDAQNKLGETPLHLAVFSHQVALAELLLKRGADYNLASKDGSTPLHIACKMENNILAVQKIFSYYDQRDHPVQINEKDKLGRTPLQWAVASLSPIVVDVLLDHKADLSNFVFPTEDYFAEKYTLDCTLQVVVFHTMSIVHSLERKGYQMDQTAAITIMKTFAKHGLIDESMDICECLRSDEEFARIAKRQLVTPDMSLYDFLQLPPEEAEKVFTMDRDKFVYEEFTSEIADLCDDSHKAYITHLCGTVAGGFFRRWALKLFSEMNPYPPTPPKINDLWNICMEYAGQDTQWLAYVRNDDVKKYYNRKLHLSYYSGEIVTKKI